VLSGRGLCDKLITRPEESYRLWCVAVCDLENVKNEEVMTRGGSQRHSKKKKRKIWDPIYCTLSMYLDYVLLWPDYGCITAETCCLEVKYRVFI
jgi:hypothetical protein